LDKEASLTEKIRREGDSTDSDLTERVLAASGFCNRHTHAIHNASSTQSAENARGCLSCARIVLKKFEENLVPILTSLKSARRPGGEPFSGVIGHLGETISGEAMCPVCEEMLESDKARIASLLQMLESRDFAEVYSKSRAMCMPHFVSAMQLVPRTSQKNVESVWGLLVRTELSSLEWVDHLHEHFKHPATVVEGRYRLPVAPGYSVEMLPESLDEYEYPNGHAWTSALLALEEA